MPKVYDEAKELRRLWSCFWSSRVVITANNLRIFDQLKSSKSAEELAMELHTDKRATEMLLDALTGLGLLKKRAGVYRNSSISDRFLVNGSPYYQGDILGHADILWKNWSGFDEVLRTGMPHNVAHEQGSFIKGMHNIATLKVGHVLKEIRLNGVKRALDLGGGPGTYAIGMARKGISVTLFDVPETIEIAKEIIEKSCAKDINFIEGDFLRDDIGNGYDLIFISQVLHSFSAEANRRLIEKSRNALNYRGRVVVQEFYIDQDRTYPVQSALFSINMLVNTEGGRCYSLSEIMSWLKEPGFKEVGARILDDSVLISGRNM